MVDDPFKAKREAALELRKRKLVEEQQRNVRLRGDTIMKQSLNTNQLVNITPSSNNRPFRNVPKIVSETIQQNSNMNKRIKLTVALLDESTFTIDSEWDDKLIAYLRKESTRSEKQKYFLPFSKYKAILANVRAMPHLDIKVDDEIPVFVQELLTNFKPLREDQKDINLKERIEVTTVDKLFDYQKEGIKFAIRLDAKCYIADEMGLGKSVQALCAMKWFQHDWPLVIVCTKSLVSKWKQDVKMWLTDIKDCDIFLPENTKETLKRVPITIINYDALKFYHDQLELGCVYRSMILDEAHNVKEITSKRTKTVYELAKKYMKHVILLSGTPFTNRPKELWSQLSMIYPNLFPEFIPFAKRYCDPKTEIKHLRGGKKQPVTSYEGATNQGELKILITNTFVIQRTKDVAIKLPDKVREFIALDVDLKPVDKELMKEFEKEIKESKNGTIVGDPNSSEKKPSKAVMNWFHDTARIKAPALSKYLEELIVSKMKILIFYHHKIMMESITEMLIRTRTNYIVINGDTSAKEREDAVNKYQQQKNIRIAVLSIKACSTGLNLTAASVVVFAELYWTPADLIQAEARIHRMGQTQPCRCIYYMAKGTIDERIYEALIEKLNMINKAGLKTEIGFGDRPAFSKQGTLDHYLAKSEPITVQNSQDDFFDDDLDDDFRELL